MSAEMPKPQLAFSASAPLSITSLLPHIPFFTNSSPPHPCRLQPTPPRHHRVRVVATAVQPSEATRTTDVSAPAPALFRCPKCETALPPLPPLKLHSAPSACRTCGNPFQKRNGYIDLTPTPTKPSAADDPPLPLKILRNAITQQPGQSIFQLPWVSYAYERGWRAAFSRAGFPGIDSELDILLDFVLPATTILDVSCGSGLMARRLATCNEFRRVVAADYSDSMLRETVAQARNDITVPEFDVVRADVSHLPFVTNAFDAVHAGAALHCWPNVQDGLREVLRVLKPGKAFMATTFLKGSYVTLGNRRNLMDNPTLRRLYLAADEALPSSPPYRFFEQEELKYIFKAAGFVDVELVVEKGFVAVLCRKPDSK